jgi:hypothetical protein
MITKDNFINKERVLELASTGLTLGQVVAQVFIDNNCPIYNQELLHEVGTWVNETVEEYAECGKEQKDILQRIEDYNQTVNPIIKETVRKNLQNELDDMMLEWANFITLHKQPTYFSNFDLYSKLRKGAVKISDIYRSISVDRSYFNTLDFRIDDDTVLMIDFDWIKEYYNQQQSEGLDLQMRDLEDRDDI